MQSGVREGEGKGGSLSTLQFEFGGEAGIFSVGQSHKHIRTAGHTHTSTVCFHFVNTENHLGGIHAQILYVHDI